MKFNLLIATAVAAVSIAGAGSAFASDQTYYLGGSTIPMTTTVASTPTLTGGDDTVAYVTTPLSASDALFSETYTFDLAVAGPTSEVSASINDIAKAPHGLSVTNLSASFYDLTTQTQLPSLPTGNGEITLADNNDYSVTITGNNTSPKYAGQYSFDVQTVPAVPGPEGFVVAIAGMGALFLVRRRASRRLAA